MAHSIGRAAALLGALLLLQAALATAEASEGEWSSPHELFETEGTIHDPAIATDGSGQVYVFWSVRQPQGVTIYHRRLDGRSWSRIAEIVSESPARTPSAASDLSGGVHLLWHGFGDILQWRRAYGKRTASENDWGRAVELGRDNAHAQIKTDSRGGIHVVYGGRAAGGVFHVFLEPSLATDPTWATPSNLAVKIAATSAANAAAANLHVAIANDGTIHVVWTEYELPDGWPPLGVFYSRSADGGASWSPPAEMAGVGYDQINVAAVSASEIHLAWNGMASIEGRYHSWSEDGGQTWSRPSMITEHGATDGPPQLVVDSAGALHLLTAYESCPWYMLWKNEEWAEPTCIAGERARASEYIEEPVMAITQGNLLHAVFWDGRKRLWYTSKRTTAPRVRPIPLLGEPTSIAQLARALFLHPWHLPLAIAAIAMTALVRWRFARQSRAPQSRPT